MFSILILVNRAYCRRFHLHPRLDGPDSWALYLRSNEVGYTLTLQQILEYNFGLVACRVEERG